MTDNIKFERFAHSTPLHPSQKREHYHFKVLIDGEHRATLFKEIFGRGYRLHDADRRAIPDLAKSYGRHLGLEVTKQADFLAVIQANLHRIPTVAQMAELRAQEVARDFAIDIEARRRIHNRQAEAYGPELLKVLKLALPILEGANTKCPTDTAFIKRVRNVIAAVDKIEERPAFDALLDGEKHHLKYSENWHPGENDGK